MSILIGLLPAFGWGVQALVMQKIGGKFTNKVMGMVLTTVLVAIIVYLFKPAHWSTNLIIGSILCGAFWSVGQILQVKSFDMVGVSMAMPISTGEQLFGAALIGAIVFKEWTLGWQYWLGISALVLIVIGIVMTAYKEKGSAAGTNVKGGLIVLTISSIGFIGYATIPTWFHLDSWDVMLPQGISMLVCTMILVAFQKDNGMFGKKSWQNMLTGVFFALANITVLFSNQLNGVAVGWTLSQMNVIVSTLGGLWFLHEARTHKEMKFTIIGLALVVIGAVMIGITRQS